MRAHVCSGCQIEKVVVPAWLRPLFAMELSQRHLVRPSSQYRERSQERRDLAVQRLSPKTQHETTNGPPPRTAPCVVIARSLGPPSIAEI